MPSCLPSCPLSAVTFTWSFHLSFTLSIRRFPFFSLRVSVSSILLSAWKQIHTRAISPGTPLIPRTSPSLSFKSGIFFSPLYSRSSHFHSHIYHSLFPSPRYFFFGVNASRTKWATSATAQFLSLPSLHNFFVLKANNYLYVYIYIFFSKLVDERLLNVLIHLVSSLLFSLLIIISCRPSSYFLTLSRKSRDLLELSRSLILRFQELTRF